MHVLVGRGIKVTNGQLAKFLHFVQERCPWFPDQGTVSLATLQKVEEEIREYYVSHRPKKVPAYAFAL